MGSMRRPLTCSKCCLPSCSCGLTFVIDSFMGMMLLIVLVRSFFSFELC
jgi:hypothetical protein